ncbi:TRAM domain-containing protein [Laceyella tengchongensis]|uniref:TRAM domain-containing protein n=1 Tax=Laceyella tengchongensis TaxID=574699 RepID=UPI002FDAFCDE
MQPGQLIELEVTGQAHDGAGVGKYEGFAVFVPLTVPGETVRVRIESVKKITRAASCWSWCKPIPTEPNRFAPSMRHAVAASPSTFPMKRS